MPIRRVFAPESTRSHWAKHAPLWGWNDWQQHQRKASWAYANTTWPEVNPAWKQQITDRFMVDATTLLHTTQSAPYHNGARLDVPTWIGWAPLPTPPPTPFISYRPMP